MTKALTIWVSAAALAAAVLVSCSSGPDAGPAQPTTVIPTETPSPTGPTTIAFGESADAEGLLIKVGKPYSLPDSEFGETGRKFAVPYTVTNNTTEPYDVGLEFGETAIAAGKECTPSHAYWSGSGVDGAPYVNIQPGRSLKWKTPIACRAPKGAELTIEVKPYGMTSYESYFLVEGRLP